MRVLRHGGAAALLALLLAACGSEPVEWKPAANPPPPLTAVPADQQPEFERQLGADLKTIVDHAGKPWLQLATRGDGEPAWYLADEAFHGDSGELDAAALSPLATLAQRVTQAGPCVVHVIGERVGDADRPSSDIGERRAAAVAAVLGQFGVSPEHLRYESRLVTGRAAGVDIVVRTIVQGSEQTAWMPPPVTGG